jgi:hypothetical protein
MTLNEAITDLETKYKSNYNLQLAGWLSELKKFREQKEPKTGHWIIIDDCELFMAKCSECGEIVDSRMISKYPYCHCGAKMVESEAE